MHNSSNGNRKQKIEKREKKKIFLHKWTCTSNKGCVLCMWMCVYFCRSIFICLDFHSVDVSFFGSLSSPIFLFILRFYCYYHHHHCNHWSYLLVFIHDYVLYYYYSFFSCSLILLRRPYCVREPFLL